MSNLEWLQERMCQDKSHPHNILSHAIEVDKPEVLFHPDR